MVHPLELQCTHDPDMNDDDIKALWEKTVNSQRSIDKFLSGKMSENDFCEIMACNGIDPDALADVYHNNLKELRLQ